MRARAAKQRFPIAQWKEELSVMQDTAIKLSQKQAFKQRPKPSKFSTMGSGIASPTRFWSGQSSLPGTVPSTALTSALPTAANTAPNSAFNTAPPSGRSTRQHSPTGENSTRRAIMSLGLRTGPGHATPEREGRLRKRLTKSRPTSRAPSASGLDSAPGSRNTSPTRRFKRKSKSQVRESAMLMTSEDVPPIPSMLVPEQAHAARASRFTEVTEHDDLNGNNLGRSDVRRLRFEDDNLAEEISRGLHAGGDSINETVVDEYILTPEQQATSVGERNLAALRFSLLAENGPSADAGPPRSRFERTDSSSSISSMSEMPVPQDRLLNSGSNTPSLEEQQQYITAPAAAYLNLDTVLQGKKDYKLQSVEPFFTDPTGLYQNAFEKKLEKLDGKSSEGPLCVEEYLTASEKDWFNRFRNVKMGKSAASTPASSVFRLPLTRRNSSSSISIGDPETMAIDEAEYNRAEQYLLNDDYQPPTGVRRLMMRRIGQWPLYSFLLAFVSIPPAELSSMTDMATGPNNRSKFISNHTTHRCGRSSGGETLHHRYHLHGLFHDMVGDFPNLQICLRACHPVCLLWTRLLPTWHGAICEDRLRTWLGAKYGYRILCHCIGQRRVFLCLEFRQ